MRNGNGSCARGWKDVSRFDRGTKDRTPTTYEYQGDGVRVVVTRHRDFPPDVWVMCADPVGVGPTALMSAEIAEAQREALNAARSILQKMLDSLNKG